MKAGRFIGAAIAAVMTFCCMAGIHKNGFDMSVFAEENGFVISTDADGDKYISGYTGSGGDIVIPSGVVWIGEKAFYGNTSITSVTIPKSCWYWVDKNAFRDCTKLRSVTFEGSIDGIGESAFSGCTALERVTFDGDVGREDGSGGIGYRAFYGCSSLKVLKFSDSTAKLDMIGEHAFMNCTSLSQAELPADLSVIYSGAFLNCRALSVVSVPSGTKLDGKYIFGYMYGSTEQDGKKGYALADGKKKLYIADSAKSVSQEPVTLVVGNGSDAERYAVEYKVNYMYGATPVSKKKLPAPDGLKSTPGTDSVVLEWDAVNGASGYRVYMYDAASGKYEVYKSVKSTKCTVTGLKAGEKYKFKVAALRGANGRYTAGTASGELSVSLKK
ncbi:MAG: fibronectin type III domain-containing protein [Oscillospiraceae bacterium]|nr:fibronectin type III domain-containing protein [Oscillospiraceae bacterium]